MKLRGALSDAQLRRRREVRAASTKKSHDKRRKEAVCINNPKHGEAPDGCGGRCRMCWDKKKSAEQRAYDSKKWGNR